MASLLIVEDDEDLRVLLTHNLVRQGHEVLQAGDGLQALEVVERAEIDMVIADVAMPRMDGFELCRRLRESPSRACIPFLFLTARADPDTQYQGLRLGAADFLTKPIELPEFVARVQGRLDGMADRGDLLSGMSATTIAPPRRASTPARGRATGPMAGFVVNDRFRIEHPLGEGGMGMVYLATQLSFGRRVALKWMTRGREHEDALERFRREAELASRIAHPSVVPIYDFGVEVTSRVPFLVMALVPGSNLRSRLESGEHLALSTVLEITLQVAGALDAAHRASVIHRDLKPENVMIHEAEGHVRVTVLDFGVARSFDERAQPRLTQTGDLVGTPLAMSPEQVRGSGVGPATDLYALGCLLHELLTGHPPFEAESALEVLTLHLSGPRPRLEPAGLPPGLVALHDQLLAVAPDERPASARAVVDRLTELVEESRPSAGSHPVNREGCAHRRPM